MPATKWRGPRPGPDTEVAADDLTGSLLSPTRMPLTRPVAFRFALDPTCEQEQRFRQHAGAARYAYNHHVARVRANLAQRRAEATYDIDKAEETPALSWSKVSFINEFNLFKTGRLPYSPQWVGDDGVVHRGLAWRDGLAQDVFECASGNAAQALENRSNSVKGRRKGKKPGMPKFKKRARCTPSFKLRSKTKPGQIAPLRIAGPKSVRLPVVGIVRIHGCTRQVRRMLAAGRLHLYGATVKFERGRWWVSLQGVAAEFHPTRRSPAGRHQMSAGMDRGSKTRAVVADSEGVVLRVEEGDKSLQHAQVALRRARWLGCFSSAHLRRPSPTRRWPTSAGFSITRPAGTARPTGGSRRRRPAPAAAKSKPT